MMPKAVAETDAFKQIDSQIGSGPFIYQKDQSKPGEKHVYLKNPKYKPRSEPASGLAGGKVAKVDRVEIIEMPDTQQQVNALIAGEIDLIEQPPHDLIPLLKKDKSVRARRLEPARARHSSSASTRCREAVRQSQDPHGGAAAMRQEDYLKATVGEPEYYKVCPAAFVCGTPNAFDKPNGLLVKPDFEKSKALLKEAGYDGTPIVLMQSTTLPVLTNMAPVTKSLLEQAGFKVDMQSMDWQTLVTRRTKKDPADKGGWNILPHLLGGGRRPEPDLDLLLGRQGRQGVVRLADRSGDGEAARRLSKETDPAKAKALAKAVQDRALETAQYGWIGQWYGPGAPPRQCDRLAQGAGAGYVEY